MGSRPPHEHPKELGNAGGQEDVVSVASESAEICATSTAAAEANVSQNEVTWRSVEEITEVVELESKPAEEEGNGENNPEGVDSWPKKTEPDALDTSSFLDNEIVVVHDESGNKREERTPVQSEVEEGKSLTDLRKKMWNFLLSKNLREKDENLNLEQNATNSSSDTLPGKKGKLLKKIIRRPVVISYPQSQRPRQPFMNQYNQNRESRMPNPPPYYANSMRRNDEQQDEEENRRQVVQVQPRQEIAYRPGTSYGPGDMVMMPNLLMNICKNIKPKEIKILDLMLLFLQQPLSFYDSGCCGAYWAPYPEKIPSNVPACLAHLVAADSLFIVQQMDMIELFLDISEPNYYLIQNTSGQCLYYAYETSNICLSGFCRFDRGFQLHIMDMYHNEIIYMNKACGCNNCFCCYPVLEVYSPPLVPVGAITQVFNFSKTEFAILDADENKAFKIYGPCCCLPTCLCGEVDFTIHALDYNETEVGVIRRELGGFITSYYSNTDYYGISFPVDLDVRLKAAFLGALFLIEYTYYDTKA